MMKPLVPLLLSSLLTTCLFANSDFDMVVASDGSGDFTSIQEAINATKSFPPKRVTIYIKNGTYHEKVHVYSWNPDLTLIGESVEHTVVTYDDHFSKLNLGRNSTFHTYTMKVSCDNFVAENLTIENSAGPVGQAVALHVEGDRCVFRNVKMLGHQDTLYAAGSNSRQYFKDCTIEGTTDFIFGAATVLFENCKIHSLSDSYITAASTSEGAEYGFVFKNCRLTHSDDVTAVYLGRPWRKYAKTVFFECELGKHIHPEGWKEWSNREDLTTVFYAEFNNTGSGANTGDRIQWSHQLNVEEAQRYQLANIFGDWDPKEDQTP